MDSKLHSFPGPKANQFIFHKEEIGEVSMSTNIIQSPSPFSSQVPMESHLSTYCSQFVSIQNIDHLLSN